MLIALLLAVPSAGQVLREFKGCRLSPTEWADGDSFEVLFPDGVKHTIRLYGVDCMEMHVNGDDSNARRLRDQRRHFGIADILTAKATGEAAKNETIALLAKPFTVHTAFADGRGDGRFARVLAFVRTDDGNDLAEALVSKGLARAFGITRQRPDGTSGDDWQEHLGDLELTAARAGAGAWRHTDWTKLPALREEARRETAEIEQAKGVRKADENRPIDLNTAPRDELMTLPGIAEKTANAIVQARPFRCIEDLDGVPGIGPATIERLRPFITVKPPP
jgi:competence protein ComEA